VISHSDREHQGGLASILSTISVKSLLLPHHAGCAGAHFSTERTSVQLFKMENPKHANDSSCVMRVAVPSPTGQEQSVLLLGDLTPVGQKALLAAWPADLLRSSVVQMPGQGTRKTWFPSFVQSIKPSYALIQVGQAHWRGYPKPEALAPLEQQNTHVLRTDIEGAISLKLTAGKPASIWREKHDCPRYYETRPIRAER
jgi:beta-lactamase superfamily II metal-dependent hydrolase